MHAHTTHTHMQLCILVFDVSRLSVKLVGEWLQYVTQYVDASKLAIFINKVKIIAHTNVTDVHTHIHVATYTSLSHSPVSLSPLLLPSILIFLSLFSNRLI